MNCTYCDERPLGKRKNSPTCGDNECKRIHRNNVSREYMAARKANGNPVNRATYNLTCELCGASFVNRSRATQRYCDRQCRDLANLASGQQARASKVANANRHKSTRPKPVKTSCPLAWAECPTCGKVFCHDAGRARKYCSPACKDSVYFRAQGRPWSTRAPAIFADDNYTCWLCNEQTSERWTSGDPLAPTIDHVTPRSLGGGNERSNLRTAHLICNSLRGNNTATNTIDIYEALERTAWASA